MSKQDNISVNIEFDNEKHAYMHEEIATSSDGIYRLIKSGKSLIMQGDEGEVELSMEHLFLEMINAHKNKGETKTKVDALVEALEKLACLGNGEYYGNSNGNMIARDALAAIKEAE